MENIDNIQNKAYLVPCGHGMVYEHVIHHERIVIMYDTMGTQIENASIWHINSMFIHGEHMVHTSSGIMQSMECIKISQYV